VRRIYRKLDVDRRRKAVTRARELCLLTSTRRPSARLRRRPTARESASRAQIVDDALESFAELVSTASTRSGTLRSSRQTVVRSQMTSIPTAAASLAKVVIRSS
jgi:hypothetical protein